MFFELGPITHNKVQGKQQTETNQSQDQQHTETTRQKITDNKHTIKTRNKGQKKKKAHKTANNRYRTYLKRPRVNPRLGKA